MKKGFTLIELIAILVVLVLIALVGAPEILDTIDRMEERKEQEFLDNIYTAAENYISLNDAVKENLTQVNDAIFISLQELIDNEYISNKSLENDDIVYTVDSTVKVTLRPGYTYGYELFKDDSRINSYNTDGILAQFDGYTKPLNNVWKDLSNHGNDINVEGAIYNAGLSFDGNDDYAYIDEINWNSSKVMTIEFTADIKEYAVGIIFESSTNSNNNSGSFYIDTNEFGTNDITLAMKYGSLTNHKYVDNVNNGLKHYTIIFDSSSTHDNFIRIYVNGQLQTIASSANSDLSNQTLSNYPLYIASRAGSSIFTEMDLKSLRLYNRALTSNEIQNNYKIDKNRFGIGG